MHALDTYKRAESRRRTTRVLMRKTGKRSMGTRDDDKKRGEQRKRRGTGRQ